jgi:hypothetical protein
VDTHLIIIAHEFRAIDVFWLILICNSLGVFTPSLYTSTNQAEHSVIWACVKWGTVNPVNTALSFIVRAAFHVPEGKCATCTDISAFQ